jgi:hypothetical protein
VAKDQRLYGKFTLNFPRHAKVSILSDAAFRCLVEATLYSRDELTDGLLARRYAVARWGLGVLQELCTNDDEKPSLIEVEKGWLIHDYADHQDTKAEVEARSARNKAAGQRGGLAKSKRAAKQVASESLSEVVAVVETETETKSFGQFSESATETLGGGLSATPGAELVRELIPNDHPAAVRTALRIKASELIRSGTPRADVAAALALWLTKPSLGPNALPSLVSEAIKARAAPGKPVNKLRSIAALAAEARAAEQTATVRGELT